MRTVPFQESYRQTFIDLNSRWILDNFGQLEPSDLVSFEQINESLTKGGMFFFAVEEDHILACCGVVPLSDGTWELEKWDPIRKFPTGEPARQFLQPA